MDLRSLLLSSLKSEYERSSACIIWMLFKNGGSSGIYEGAANISMAETALYFSNKNDILCIPKRNTRYPFIDDIDLFDRNRFNGILLEIGNDEFSQMDKWLYDNIEEYKHILTNGSAIIASQCTEYIERISQELNVPILNILTSQQVYLNDKTNLYNIMQSFHIDCPYFKICGNMKELNSEFEEMKKKHKMVLLKSTDNLNRKIVHPIKKRAELVALKDRLQFPCIIEPFYRVTNSYNFQFYINSNIEIYLGSSIQLVNNQNGNIIHAGNILTNSNQKTKSLWNKCYNLSLKFLKNFKERYVGIVGLDIIETITGEILLVDINPRFNASTFMHSDIISQIQVPYKMFFFFNFQYDTDWYIAIKTAMERLNSLESDLKCYMIFSPVIANNTIFLNLLAISKSTYSLMLLEKHISNEYGLELHIKNNI